MSIPLLQSALEIMDQIWGLTYHQFQRGVSAEEKSDSSLVTETDKRAERLLREYVATHHPDHGVIGEEFYEEQKPQAEYQWIVDPIDGTQNFFHGIPTYGTILGVHHKGKPIVGIIDHPALNIRVHGTEGGGAFWNRQKLVIADSSTPEKLDSNEIIGLATRGMFARTGDEHIFDAITAHHGSHRVYFDIYATSLAIRGSLGGMVEYNVTSWDCAATELLVTEAGGAYQLVKEVPRDGLPPRISAVYGKPSVVAHLIKLLDGV